MFSLPSIFVDFVGMVNRRSVVLAKNDAFWGKIRSLLFILGHILRCRGEILRAWVGRSIHMRTLSQN